MDVNVAALKEKTPRRNECRISNFQAINPNWHNQALVNVFITIESCLK